MMFHVAPVAYWLELDISVKMIKIIALLLVQKVICPGSKEIKVNQFVMMCVDSNMT